VTPQQFVLSSIFALSLAMGQTLFKLAANHWQRVQTPANQILSIISPWFIAAVISYGLTALLWIYILRNTALTKAYAFSIAGSALVPVIAFLVFKEPLTAKYAMGFVLVLAGIYLCIS